MRASYTRTRENTKAVRAGIAEVANGAANGMRAVEADVELQLDAAGEMTQRLRRASLLVMQLLARGRLAEAAAAAGQVSMLGRQAEIRLLSALERRAGAAAVVEAAAASLPQPESPRLTRQRLNQRVRREAGKSQAAGT